MTLLAEMIGGRMRGGRLGEHRGENRPQRSAPDNDPERCAAKGLKPFDIDGVIVYAGTLKAARKKAHLLAMIAAEKEVMQ